MRKAAGVTLTVVALCAACMHPARVTPGAGATRQLDVTLEADEADAALGILRKESSGTPLTDDDWRRLFASRGYLHLAERERSMRGAFTDSAFAAFLRSDSARALTPALTTKLPRLEHVDPRASAARALACLPAGTPLHARLYLEIKPAKNSFVFTGADSLPSIFLYVNPHETEAQLADTLAHELHHIGLNAACSEPALSRATAAIRMLLLYLGAFGEGAAMLAAAGSPDVNPHAADDDTIQERWNRDVSHAPADMQDLSHFWSDVLDGTIVSADSVQVRAASYYGVQGPWYTVGWLMVSTIERELGRRALIDVLCEPTALLRTYNGHTTRRPDGRTGAPRICQCGMTGCCDVSGKRADIRKRETPRDSSTWLCIARGFKTGRGDWI